MNITEAYRQAVEGVKVDDLTKLNELEDEKLRRFEWNQHPLTDKLKQDLKSAILSLQSEATILARTDNTTQVINKLKLADALTKVLNYVNTGCNIND